MQRKFKNFYAGIERVIGVLEIALSLILIAGVVVAGVILVGSLYGMLSGASSADFQHFMDEALLYLIGLEVALMLIKRDPHLVVDILTFAIARKMIVNMTHGVDFLFGALAILVLYMVKCYGISCFILPGQSWLGRTMRASGDSSSSSGPREGEGASGGDMGSPS